MTRAEVERFLGAHQEAFRQRSPEALALTHSPAGTFESPAHGLIHGREAIRDMYRYWYSAFPDLLLEWTAPLIEAPRAAVFWNFTGTSQGPFFGDVRPGTVVTMIGAAEYVFDADGIASVRHIFDFSRVLVSTGVLKIKPA